MLEFLKSGEVPKGKQYYCGVLLREATGAVMILEVESEHQRVSVRDEQGFNYTNGWENIVDDVDAALYELEKKNEVRTERIIFFLYSHLVDQEEIKIKAPYDEKIKKIASELDLKPLGFIEYHESIASLLQDEERTPLTALIVEIDQPAVSVFLYKVGKMARFVETAKTEDIVTDLEDLFHRLKDEFLPTRIIIYDSTMLEAESARLINHNFGEALFVQIPQMEVFSPDKLTQSLLASFKKQLFEKTDEVSGAIPEEAIVKEPPTPGPILSPEPEAKIKEVNDTGFVAGEDVADYDKPLPTAQNSFLTIWLSKLKSFIPAKPGYIPIIKLAHKELIFSIIGLMLMAGSLFCLLFFFHRAHITVLFKSPNFEKKIIVTAQIEASSESALNIAKIDETISEQASGSTTGKKSVGDPGKGTLTIYNLEKAERSFKKGTIVATSDGIKFLLDNDIKIASAASTVTPEGDVKITTGKKSISATADSIGPKGNIKKGIELTFEGISRDSARASSETDFSGGSEKEVRTVSKADQLALLNIITQNIKNKGETVVSQNAGTDKTISELTEIKIVDRKFSKEISEEADTVSLDVKATVTFYSYSDPSMRTIILSMIGDVVPDGYSMGVVDLNYSITNVEKKADKINLQVTVKGKPQKKLDNEVIKKSIAGKARPELDSIMKDDLHADGYELNVTAPFFLKNRVPFFINNISVSSGSL